MTTCAHVGFVLTGHAQTAEELIALEAIAAPDRRRLKAHTAERWFDLGQSAALAIPASMT